MFQRKIQKIIKHNNNTNIATGQSCGRLLVSDATTITRCLSGTYSPCLLHALVSQQDWSRKDIAPRGGSMKDQEQRLKNLLIVAHSCSLFLHNFPMLICLCLIITNTQCIHDVQSTVQCTCPLFSIE